MQNSDRREHKEACRDVTCCDWTSLMVLIFTGNECEDSQTRPCGGKNIVSKANTPHEGCWFTQETRVWVHFQPPQFKHEHGADNKGCSSIMETEAPLERLDL